MFGKRQVFKGYSAVMKSTLPFSGPTEKLLYMVIRVATDVQEGMTLQEMARRCCCTVEEVQACLVSLEQKGFFEETFTRDGNIALVLYPLPEIYADAE